jgi:FlgD Ig-like domain
LTHSRFIPIVLLSTAVALTLAPPSAAQIVSRFEVRETVVSPDGDTKQDSTRVRYALTANALAVSLVVFEADSTTPVDTLRAPAPDVPGPPRDSYWKGRRWDGSPAPEGAYVVTLRVTPESGPDVVRSLPIFVDITPPQVQIVSVVPDPYAPGVASGPTAVSISFLVTDASPVSVGRPPDELKSEFANPSNTVVTPALLTTTPPFAGADGAYTMAWDATDEAATLPDGEYRVTLSLVDAAGYTTPSTYHFWIDTAAPHIKPTSLADGASVSVVPDSLHGWAFDRQGVDTLGVRYASTRPFAGVLATHTRDDTLFFAVPLADSIAAEGSHTVGFRAVDGVGRVTTYDFGFRFDATAPLAPTLDAFAGAWHGSSYPLSGEVDDEGDSGAMVRVYRNGTLVDSVSTAARNTFTIHVPMEPGRNELVAVLRDGAFNTSPPSNTVVVGFDGSAGFFAPVPFTPGASFEVNAARAARGVTLRIFDVMGDLVATIENENDQQFYSLRWDGRNGSGVATKKGPLVAVAALQYADGGQEIVREVFLYDPDAP